MTRRLAVLAFLIALFSSAMPAVTASAQPAKDKVALRLNFYSYGEHAGIAYGLDKGIYAEEDIDLTILEGGGSGPTVQAIGAGTDRFGYADATTMVKLVSKGLPVKMIANYVQTSPMAIIYFADKGIKGPKDLEGKKVSFTAGDSPHQNFPALLRLNNVDKSKIQEVLLAPQAKQTAVMTGTVDVMGGYYTIQAGAIERESGKKVSYFRYADFGVNAMTQGLLIHTKYLGDKSLNCRMVKATSRAWLGAMKDLDGAVEALHRLFPYTNKGAKDLTKKQWLDSTELLYSKNSQGKTPGLMVKEDWDVLLALAKDYAGLEPVKPHAEYYTNQFFDCR
ncbi:MAG TPA: ABC transporter substrate-binding protein [Methylomirabilota bacterium]|nr:ABC transporter substrate-binding protein [Methylomirabilota bacterium]